MQNRDEVIKWEYEIEEYGKTCGPRIVGSVLGISPAEAADKLLEAGSKSIKSTSFDVISAVLFLPYEVASVKAIGSGRTKITLNDKFYTLTQWFEMNKLRTAIVRVSDHFVYVAYGMIVESAGYSPMNGRVTHVMWLD